MHPDMEQCLISAGEIQAKVKVMAQRISADYRGKNLLVVGILKGAVLFMADLVRALDIPVCIDFIAVSSYGSSTESSGVVRIMKDLDQSIEGKHVLIVEDIIDTGLTLKYLVENLETRQAASVEVCTLLDKPDRRKIKVDVKFNGFTVPDEFLVGYGLDYNERYRHLPEVYVLKKEVYSS
ncbi:MAG: hypoxanthine phosphoribosyltransferase [Bacteroidetes bacterium]|nr:MAG: hypoxanthine phosphoribosyltransferase [Bacteroidota bacterium]